MKKPLVTKGLAAFAVLLALGVLGCTNQAVADGSTEQPTTSSFKVEGMTCGGCEGGVKLKVKKLDGVKSVDASYKEGTAEVVYDAGKVTPPDIIAALQELGYSAELVEENAADG